MSSETVARRYAGALADVVVKSGETEKIQSELKTWEEMIHSSRDLSAAFANPSIPQNSKEKILEALLVKSAPSPATANFLRILLRNGRITELGAINTRFKNILQERAGYVSGKIVSARPLADSEKAELQANVEKMTGKKVSLNFNIDENIIGGVVTTIGSTVYDGSVKTQLETLKAQLINA
jgi:F-type H+-transporting ATPase subunit delta